MPKNFQIVSGSTAFTLVTHNTVAVSNASVLALASNPSRRYVLLQDNSNQDMYINLGNAAGADAGIRINADGGEYKLDMGNLYTGDIFAIKSGGGTNELLVTEGQ